MSDRRIISDFLHKVGGGGWCGGWGAYCNDSRRYSSVGFFIYWTLEKL